MAVTYRIAPDERTVYLTTEGESSFAEWRDAMLSALSDPAYRKGFYFLSDRREEAGVLGADFARSAAHFFREHSDELAGCLWAMVADRDAAYGMARMFSLLSEGTCVRVEAFRGHDEARRWLTGHHPEA